MPRRKTVTKTTAKISSPEVPKPAVVETATPNLNIPPPKTFDQLRAEAAAVAGETGGGSSESGEAPRRGRPPGSKNRPKDEAPAPAFQLPKGLIGNTFRGIYAAVGAATGVPEAWTITDDQAEALDAAGQACVTRYAPLMEQYHPELCVLLVINVAVVGSSMAQMAAIKKARKAQIVNVDSST